MSALQIIVVVAAVLVALLAAGALGQAIAGRRDRRRFPAPGRMVDIGGHRLHVHVAGRPSALATVVLEAGMASKSSNWAWVRDELAWGNRVTALAARFRLLRLFHAEKSFIAGLPRREYAEMRAYLAGPRGWSAGAKGFGPGATRRVVRSTRHAIWELCRWS